MNSINWLLQQAKFDLNPSRSASCLSISGRAGGEQAYVAAEARFRHALSCLILLTMLLPLKDRLTPRISPADDAPQRRTSRNLTRATPTELRSIRNASVGIVGDHSINGAGEGRHSGWDTIASFAVNPGRGSLPRTKHKCSGFGTKVKIGSG